MLVFIFNQHGLFWKGEAVSFVAKTTEGALTILPHHQEITSILVAQNVKIIFASSEQELEIGHSFFTFKGEELKVFTELCVWKKDNIMKDLNK